MIKIKRFGFFNSINGDRKYLASDISDAFNVAIGTGLAPIENSFKIVPNQNMTIKMKSGECMIYGCYCSDVEEEIIQLDTAHSELNRIDRVVLRYDKFERNIKTVVIKGTPALNPTPPASLKTKNQFDLVLADIRINKAVTEIKQENITDMRDSDLCGYLGGKVLEKNIFGVMQSLNSSGYRKLPEGLILQWLGAVSIAPNAGYATLVLPTTFPQKAIIGLATQHYDSGGSTSLNINFTTQLSTNNITLYARNPDNTIPTRYVSADILVLGC